MAIPYELFKYLIGRFFKVFLIIFFALSFITILLSYIEISKLSFSRNISFEIVSQMVLLKYPYLMQKILPFCFFLACISSLSILNKNLELIVMKSFGISTWQFLLPIIFCSFILGVFIVCAFNPIASAMLSKHEKMRLKYVKGNASEAVFSSSGIWLKEKYQKHNLIIHSNSAYGKEVILLGVDIFELDENNQFINRINANKAKLKNGNWELENAIVLRVSKQAEFFKHYKIPTNMELTKLQDSFAVPEEVSIWELNDFIHNIKKTGLSATRHLVYFYSLLIYPFYICAMTMISASFVLNFPRKGKNSIMIISGIAVESVIYFLNNIIMALGSSGRMNPFLSVTLPTIMSFLIAFALIIHSEEN